jgi:hypothetical protein
MEFFGVVWFGLVAMTANLIWLHSFESSAKPGSRPIVSERIAKCGRTGALLRVDSLLITGRTGGRVRNSFGGGWPGGLGGVLSARRIASSRRRAVSSGVYCSSFRAFMPPNIRG